MGNCYGNNLLFVYISLKGHEWYISPKFYWNTEANALEFLEDLGEILLQTHMQNDVCNWFKSLTPSD